jgi:DNA-binding HxlR family transcriptional regulator
MGMIGDTMRNVAKKVDPSPSETMVNITPAGRERAPQLLGKSQLGLILNHLNEFSPQSVSEIANATEMNPKLVRKNLDVYPTYFEVRTR